MKNNQQKAARERGIQREFVNGKEIQMQFWAPSDIAIPCRSCARPSGRARIETATIERLIDREIE